MTNNLDVLFLSESKVTRDCIQFASSWIGYHCYFVVEVIEGKSGLILPCLQSA